MLAMFVAIVIILLFSLMRFVSFLTPCLRVEDCSFRRLEVLWQRLEEIGEMLRNYSLCKGAAMVLVLRKCMVKVLNSLSDERRERSFAGLVRNLYDRRRRQKAWHESHPEVTARG